MTSVTSFVTYGRPQALNVGLLGIVCVGLIAANLFAMAKLGDDYTHIPTSSAISTRIGARLRDQMRSWQRNCSSTLPTAR